MKKLSFVLVLAMLLSLVPFTVSAAEEVWDGKIPQADAEYKFSGGEGTENLPYLISSAADLAMLAANVNAGNDYELIFFKLTADITLNSGYENSGTWLEAPPANKWMPIGYNLKNSVSPAFYGTFDGDYHVIRGMYCHADDKAGAENNGWNSTVGLFGALNGSVKRLGFENCVVDRSKTVGNGAGILCALLGNNTSSMNPKVSEVYVKDSISAAFRSPGVIAGTVQKGVISDCYTVGSKAVLYRTDGEGDAGTIVGYISASAGVGSVKDCYTLSQLVIPAENKSSVSGPVVGNVNSMGDVQNVYYDPQISRVDAENVTRAYIHNDAKDYVELIELSKDKMTVSAMKLNKNLWKDADGEVVLRGFTGEYPDTGDTDPAVSTSGGEVTDTPTDTSQSAEITSAAPESTGAPASGTADTTDAAPSGDKKSNTGLIAGISVAAAVIIIAAAAYIVVKKKKK